MKLNQEEIKTILPHRDPMLLVTSVEELTPGEEIRASFYADPRGRFFPATFRATPSSPASTRWSVWGRRRISSS